MCDLITAQSFGLKNVQREFETMGNLQQNFSNKLYDSCCGEVNYHRDIDIEPRPRQSIDDLKLQPHPQPRTSYPNTINSDMTRKTTREKMSAHQPFYSKSEYNHSTTIFLTNKQPIDLNDKNYRHMASFRKSIDIYNPRTPPISPNRKYSPRRKSKKMKFTEEDEDKMLNTSQSNSHITAEQIVRATTEEKIKNKLKPESLNWSQDGIMSLDFDMIECEKPPLLNIYMDDIIYYKSIKTGYDYVIGCTPCMPIMQSEFEDGVYRYNLNTSEYEFLCDIPEELCDYQAYLAFDHENEVLHFLFGDGNVWGKYDLNNNVWQVISTPDDYPNQYGITRYIVYFVSLICSNCNDIIFHTNLDEL